MSAVSAMTEASGEIGTPVGSGISLLVAIVFAFACYKIAQSKGRGPILWGILGFFFSIITLIVILVIPRKN